MTRNRIIPPIEDFASLLTSETILEGDRRYVAAKYGGEFHFRITQYSNADSDGTLYWVIPIHSVHLYVPPHPSMTRDDIEGVTYAWDDGDHWYFAHCSPEEHRQFAADAEAFARGQFDDPIQEINAKIGYNAQNNGARNSAFAEVTALIKFARLVGRRVHEVVVGATLGHYHRNPHADHKRALTVAAIDRILGTWRQNSAADPNIRADHSRVADEVAEVRKRLVSTDTIETRAERHQRFIRLSARGQDPLGGMEYIFTSSVDGETITGDANLPDAAWAFDAAGLKAGISRGEFVYYDGIPGNISPDRPYAVRFARPVSPAGSAWTQAESFRIYGGQS